MTPNDIPALMRLHASVLLEGGLPTYDRAELVCVYGSLVEWTRWAWADRAHQALHLCLVADLVEQGDLYVDWRGICAPR